MSEGHNWAPGQTLDIPDLNRIDLQTDIYKRLEIKILFL